MWEEAFGAEVLRGRTLGEVEEGGSLQWEGRRLRVAGNVGRTCRPPSSRQPPTSQTGLLAPTRPGPDCGGGRPPGSRVSWPGGGLGRRGDGGAGAAVGSRLLASAGAPSLLAKQSPHKICKWYNYCYLFC